MASKNGNLPMMRGGLSDKDLHKKLTYFNKESIKSFIKESGGAITADQLKKFMEL